MDEKEFFAKLSEIGPDGKFSSQFNATNNGVDLKMKKIMATKIMAEKTPGKKTKRKFLTDRKDNWRLMSIKRRQVLLWNRWWPALKLKTLIFQCRPIL